MTDTQNKGTALITGASTGIGAVYADRLTKRGYDVVLVARSADKLGTLADRLKSESGRSVEVLVADLNAKPDLQRVAEKLTDDTSITMLVNNAGLGAMSPLISSDFGAMEEMIGLNVTALTRLAHAVIPGFVARGGGTLINISSIVAIAPELMNGVYGGTKAYVVALSQSIQHELGDKGVRVQAVLPGATGTPFWDIAGYPASNFPADFVMTPEDMVDASLAGLDQGEIITIPALPDLDEWNRYEFARRDMSARLSNIVPAGRYGIRAAA